MRALGLSLLATLPAFALMGWSSAAEASADGGCYTDWVSWSVAFNGCNDSPAMQPGNDTRSNLLLMALDARKAPQPTSNRPVVKYDDIDRYSPLLDWGRLSLYYVPSASEDRNVNSRCDSDESGSAAFVAAVTAARGLSASERSTLIDARQALKPDCDNAGTSTSSLLQNDQLQSADARAFAAYVDGAAAFYGGRQADALGHFSAAQKSKEGWLIETATYMIGRAALNQMQEGSFDRYGGHESGFRADPDQRKAAEDGFKAYLKRYPNGRYAPSARGLMRRIYWLSGDWEKLDAEYARLLSDSKQPISDLVEEIDIKYLPNASTSKSPYIVAMMDLARMRGSESYGIEGCCSKPLTAEELAGQADIFRGQQSLYNYLKAVHALNVANNPQEALRLIPDAAKQRSFTNLQFARQVLRGQALKAAKDRNERGFWLEMLPGSTTDNQRWLIELAIADYDEKHGQLERVFAKDSPVKNPSIRRILLVNSADAALLRQQARGGPTKYERETALYTLLKKQLLAGEYRSYLTDLQMVPADAYVPKPDTSQPSEDTVALGIFTTPIKGDIYPCPDIKAVASMLANQPGNAKGQLCLADFYYQNFDYQWDGPEPEKDELGSTKSPLETKPYTRLGVYQRLIANKSVRGDDRAYALNRAIRCFERSGYNHCGDQEIPQSERKSWFQQLKREFPNNPIATSLQYYW